jgi:3',5'-cyclic AMP phosphodiesterase CpdA
MRLLAISDLHLGHPVNRERLDTIGAAPDDWLVLAGDVGETEAHLAMAFDLLRPRFAKLFWVPGNHELWTTDQTRNEPRGVDRYDALVALARRFDVVTPEDPYLLWPNSGRKLAIAPLFTLYDYTFRPDDIAAEAVLDWAAAEGIVCTDEYFLHAEPYKDRAAWCAARVAATEQRLAALPSDCDTVLINHFPLRRAHARLPGVPRFAPWCGTRRTEDWHVRFRARAVIYGHLHIRQTFHEDQVQFHEVSLGYPRQWDLTRPVASYVRTILR